MSARTHASLAARRAAETATAAAMAVTVEEEFLLLRPDGSLACVAPKVRALLPPDAGAQQELLRFQLHTKTAPHTDLDALASELERTRRLAATAADSLGARLVSSGSPPFRSTASRSVSDLGRYRALVRAFPEIAEDVTAGCHVHVDVGSRDLGVAVLARLRPWLPTLLAATANSPWWKGEDTGWASYRFVVRSEWPTARLPKVWSNARSYDVDLRRSVRRGDAPDVDTVNLHARLTPLLPSVEVRLADAGLSVPDTVLIAALSRGIVATVVRDVLLREPGDAGDEMRLTTALVSAARWGLSAPGADPLRGDFAPQAELLDRMVDHVAPALADAGDLYRLRALVERLRTEGTGADRQRALRAASADAEHFVAALAEATAGRVAVAT